MRANLCTFQAIELLFERTFSSNTWTKNIKYDTSQTAPLDVRPVCKFF